MFKQKIIDIFSKYLPDHIETVYFPNTDSWEIVAHEIFRGRTTATVSLGIARVLGNKLCLSLYVGKGESSVQIFKAYDNYAIKHPDLAGYCAYCREQK
jgi:hypothetical protein